MGVPTEPLIGGTNYRKLIIKDSMYVSAGCNVDDSRSREEKVWFVPFWCNFAFQYNAFSVFLYYSFSEKIDARLYLLDGD